MSHTLNSKLKNFCDYLNGKYEADVRLYITNSGDLKLDNIRVQKEKRKQGIGSAIMNEIVSFADKNGLRLVLTTATKDPYVGTTSSGRLKKFYKRFDFVENKGKDFSISENMFRMPKQPTKLLEKANKLDELGYHKEADRITRIILAQENFDSLTNTSRAVQAYNYLLINYGISPAYLAENIKIIIQATKTGQYPAGYNEAYQGLKSLFKDPRLLDGVDIFLEQYPQLKADYQLLNNTTRYAKLGNYFEWLTKTSNVQDALEAYKSTQSTINRARDVSKALIDNGHGVITDFSKITPEALNVIQDGLNTEKKIESFEKYAKNVLSQRYPDTNWNNVSSETLFNFLKRLTKNEKSIDGIKNNEQFFENIKKLYETRNAGESAIEAAKTANVITHATEEATQSAKIVSKILGPLEKFAGPIAIVLSLPSMIEWTKKISSGEMDWSNADERADFVSDLSNFGASIAMVIPGGQPFALALSTLSLGIQGGKWLAHATNKDNTEDLKLTGELDKLSPEEKEKMKNEDYWIDLLIQEVTPGSFTDFNEFVNKIPSLNNIAIKEGGGGLDLSKIKWPEYEKLITQWIQTKPDYQKWYDWFVNPTDKNKSMKDRFLTKFNTIMSNIRKTGKVDSKAQVHYNSLEDVKKKINELYSENPNIVNRFNQTGRLSDIIKKLQNDMAPSMPAGQKWFSKVPLNLSDRELLQWFNQHSDPSEW